MRAQRRHGHALLPQLGTLYTLDQNGNVSSQTPDTGAVASWAGQWYSAPSTAERVSADMGTSPLWPISYGTNHAGNPSLTRVYTPFLGYDFGVAIWGWQPGQRSGSCRLGNSKVHLSAAAQAQYDNLRSQLIASGDIEPNSQVLPETTAPTPCSVWFSSLGQDQATAYAGLKGAVLRQQPYDAFQSTLSLYKAGFWVRGVDTVYPNVFPKVWAGTAVCARFGPGDLAMAQVEPPGTDIYIRTETSTGALASIKSVTGEVITFTQSTIVHEALHNLLGKTDDGLRQFLGLPNGKETDTTDINKALVNNGCAPN